ncbi:carboxymuconolactone decarboxylase family protein [Alkalihalophilus marmarensis]|jgi:alkylhydroperoxidase family enzyme|uniref:Alkylhydroperoxidase n=1 Tax=Alkalihalophilus marmarensis DSM 21297 TaxID=1188261 RepID=U6ST28_9BACI|nr:carboxymuconolactone decarboxylase family protein [Alkalihalophilus marmarensis]ERN53806.1 alkylhydroperoxidase [Alkalihalophilus marmarensis DSM 21297]MCM3490672.1 carboxymuconolactone decarboxylase family protein [Alkalihalophilus marmarensis]
MARITESNTGCTPFERLLGHNPDVMKAWSQLGRVLEREATLSAQLKEQVRRTLAQGNGCEYCKAKGKPDNVHCDEKTSVAVALAEVFLKQKGTISDPQFQILEEFFTAGEISELFAFISFTTASQYFGAMMMLEG